MDCRYDLSLKEILQMARNINIDITNSLILDVLKSYKWRFYMNSNQFDKFNVNARFSFDLSCHLTLLKAYMGAINKLVVNDDAETSC